MTQTLFVCRGRTVMVDDTAYGPGSQVTLDRAEAARLMALGFVSDAPPVLDPAEPSRHEARDIPGQ